MASRITSSCSSRAPFDKLSLYLCIDSFCVASYDFVSWVLVGLSTSCYLPHSLFSSWSSLSAVTRTRWQRFPPWVYMWACVASVASTRRSQQTPLHIWKLSYVYLSLPPSWLIISSAQCLCEIVSRGSYHILSFVMDTEARAAAGKASCKSTIHGCLCTVGCGLGPWRIPPGGTTITMFVLFVLSFTLSLSLHLSLACIRSHK